MSDSFGKARWAVFVGPSLLPALAMCPRSSGLGERRSGCSMVFLRTAPGGSCFGWEDGGSFSAGLEWAGTVSVSGVSSGMKIWGSLPLGGAV